MAIGTTITLGLGSAGVGNLAASVPKLMLTGLTPGAAAAAAEARGAWYPVHKASRSGRR